MKLNEQFDQNEFIEWVEQFLPEFSRDFRKVDVPNSFEGAKSIQTLGESKLGVRVYTIEMEADPSRRKVGLATDSFSLLRNYGTPNAIVAYYSQDTSQWRLSLLTSTPIWSEGKIITKLSNPKRQSYVLGPKAKVKTPHQYLVLKGTVIDFTDLKSRFSLEIVNKDFYKEISQAFIKLVGGTLAHGRSKQTFKPTLRLPSVTEHSQTSMEFAVRLIGRIIFCWFLREKKSASGNTLMPKELLSLETSNNTEDYYHRILEPIFFEILNRPIKSRKEYFENELFSSIPYLNGGLFSPHEDDFYSSNESKQAINHNLVTVPDDWLRSLFQVLETYNFTIDENTSFDEELSIDPEMLGRIFENLLAEISPETGESARKSTGSYYTPRVIVDYMVDESLKLYLKSKTGITEEKLSSLISYDLEDDATNPLNNEEKDKIADALGKIKILDPACGSGAFPIGALQKIVFILQQIDQDGQLWFKKQIQNTPVELRRVIEREFQERNFDYIRKLGIIRENIYGIDIQPIATEISRLRCFLTLIVDERVDDTLENRGIEPLPNLEFKFVTANSLIGLPKYNAGQQELFDDNSKIEELKSLRNQYFTARNEERKDLMLAFSDLQSEMINDLIDKHSFTGVAKAELTRKLTDWKPFKHKSTDWFDPEWMFGINNGFNIVIANPPYLKERDNKKNFEPVNNSEFGKKYHQGKMDFWFYFLHKAIDLVEDKGAISYITSRYWLNSKGAKKLIKRVAEELSFDSFIDIGKLKVFDSVAGQHMVAVYKKSKEIDAFTYKKLRNDLSDINQIHDTANVEIKRLYNSSIFSSNNEIILDINHEDMGDIVSLGEIADISQGVVEATDKVSNKQMRTIKNTSNINAGDGVFVLDESELNNLQINASERTVIKKYLDPNDIFKYGFRWNNKFLIYSDKETRELIRSNPDFTNLKNHLDKYSKFITSSNKPYGLHRARESKYFINPKIIFKGMFVNNELAFDEEGYYVGFSFSLIIQKDPQYSLKYILALLNSTFALNWFNNNGKKRGVGVDIGVEKLRLFPVKIADKPTQKKFIDLVDKILMITRSDDYLENNLKQEQVKEDEKLIDKMVNELYGSNKEDLINVDNPNE